MKSNSKSIFLLAFLAIFLVRTENAFAQYERPTESISFKKSNAFISVGSGMHYKYGILGLGFGMLLNENTVSEFNFGLGVYGFKTGATMVFNAGTNKKWRPTLGFSRTAGSENVQMDVMVVHNLNDYTITTEMDFSAAHTLTPGFQRVFLFRNGSNLALDFGYAIALNTPSYGFSEKILKIEGNQVAASTVEFTEPQELAFRLIRPSGIVFGLSYNFGL